LLQLISNYQIPNTKLPISALVTAQQIAHVAAVCVEYFFDAAVAEGELPHPLDAATYAGRQRDVGAGARAGVEAVGGEVVVGQVLTIVVRGDVVDVHLVALLQVVEVQVNVGQTEYEALHLQAEVDCQLRVLGEALRVRAGQERVEDDDGLVQVPDEDALELIVGGAGRVKGGGGRRGQLGVYLKRGLVDWQLLGLLDAQRLADASFGAFGCFQFFLKKLETRFTVWAIYEVLFVYVSFISISFDVIRKISHDLIVNNHYLKLDL